jgi:hypothetical protein
MIIFSSLNKKYVNSYLPCKPLSMMMKKPFIRVSLGVATLFLLTGCKNAFPTETASETPGTKVIKI